MKAFTKNGSQTMKILMRLGWIQENGKKLGVTMSRPYDHAPKNKTEFGIRLQKLIRKRNFKMREFSRLIGYSEPAVHHWMYGLCEMRISTFANVVDVLQLSATEIAYLLEPFWEDKDE